MIYIYRHTTNPSTPFKYVYNGPVKDSHKAYILETEEDALKFVTRIKMSDELAETILLWTAAYKGIPIMVFVMRDNLVLSLMRDYDHIPHSITLPKRFRKLYPHL